MEIKNRIYNNTLYVLLHGELDEHSAAATRIKLDDIFKLTGFRQIIIDLSELDFMDSTGIGVLIGRYKKMKDKNIDVISWFSLAIYTQSNALKVAKTFNLPTLDELDRIIAEDYPELCQTVA